MSRSFRLVALPYEPFARYFRMEEDELRAAGARLSIVGEKPGSPCRVSLVDAEVGERVALVAFEHHDVPSPYRASGPIIVREGAVMARPGAGEIPEMLHHRLLSVRAYDAAGMLVDAEVLEGRGLAGAIERIFEDPRVSYLHLHNARPGCYNCRVVRA